MSYLLDNKVSGALGHYASSGHQPCEALSLGVCVGKGKHPRFLATSGDSEVPGFLRGCCIRGWNSFISLTLRQSSTAERVDPSDPWTDALRLPSTVLAGVVRSRDPSTPDLNKVSVRILEHEAELAGKQRMCG